MSDWVWDLTLYRGSAEFYAAGREPYPPTLVDALVDALGLDGTGRLLDVGCGPGSLLLLLAPHVATAIGIDADPDMIEAARRSAVDLPGVRLRVLRAEDLPADLAPVDVITFAQSFHWMRREQVAGAARALLRPGGVLVHVSATTHEGVDSGREMDHPRPPWAAITALVRRFLGPQRRAGQSVLTNGTPSHEDEVFRAAGLVGPDRIELAGWVADRSEAQVVAGVYSLSGSAPHLFGLDWPDFDAELRSLVAAASDSGWFTEEFPPITLRLWR